MSVTGNKRVSQLVELTSNEIQPNDLFLIIDATARESKKIKASELEIYLQGSGSFVMNADTASYIIGNRVDGAVSLALMAYSSSTSLYSLLSNQSISSSRCITASYALNGGNSGTSASYLIYLGNPNGTSSYSMRTLLSDVASTSNFLSYFGGNNGTASYAISTKNVVNADTASYLNYSIGASVATASYAYVAQTAYSGFSNSSSYLIYSPNNGTASYAMTAKTFANIITNRGVYLADTQSTVLAQIDSVDVYWSTNGMARTPIEVVGTIVIPFTSSIVTDGDIYLSVINRNTGVETILDSTSIYFNLSPTTEIISGSIKQPFTLLGQSNLYGSYFLFVSSSNNLQIEPSRMVRFNISSETDNFNIRSDVPIKFDVVPENTAIFTFTSIDGGPFTDNTNGLLEMLLQLYRLCLWL